jgi:hypothetical protein
MAAGTTPARAPCGADGAAEAGVAVAKPPRAITQRVTAASFGSSIWTLLGFLSSVLRTTRPIAAHHMVGSCDAVVPPVEGKLTGGAAPIRPTVG